MRKIDAAWLSGLFDADGSVASCMRSNGASIWAVRIAMTHEATIQRCFDLLLEEGIQMSHGACQYKRNVEGSSEGWVWYVQTQGRPKVLAFARLVLPYSITKKEKLLESVRYIEGLRKG